MRIAVLALLLAVQASAYLSTDPDEVVDIVNGRVIPRKKDDSKGGRTDLAYEVQESHDWWCAKEGHNAAAVCVVEALKTIEEGDEKTRIETQLRNSSNREQLVGQKNFIYKSWCQIDLHKGSALCREWKEHMLAEEEKSRVQVKVEHCLAPVATSPSKHQPQALPTFSAYASSYETLFRGLVSVTLYLAPWPLRPRCAGQHR